MWLQATITTADLALALRRFCPARIEIDEGRWLSVARPRMVKMLPDLGARFVTDAKVRWNVLGIDVPITVKEIEIFLKPRIDTKDAHQSLAFAVSIGDFDVKYVPSVFDRGIASRINDALAEANISWDFSKTLDFNFGMPKQLSPVDSVHLQARWADLKISDVALTIATSLTVDVSRQRPVTLSTID